MLELPILSHCRDHRLSVDGVMHESRVDRAGSHWCAGGGRKCHGLSRYSAGGATGAHLHIQHVSTAEAVDLVRRAKERGITVTAEACPHHFTLTHEAVRGYDTSTKVNPPLRTAEDVEAIKMGLQDGTLDVIASDHAPHHVSEKDQDYAAAPAGMIGLETSVGLALRLYHAGVLSLPQVIAKYTVHPASILGVPYGVAGGEQCGRDDSRRRTILTKWRQRRCVREK